MNTLQKPTDDYDWPSYTEIYAKQTADMQGEGSQFLVKDSFVKDDRIIWKDNLHQNWKELYTQVATRKITSVFECGCGPGYHLYKIQKLMPKVKIFGAELLQTQLDFGRDTLKIPEDLYENVGLIDFSIPCASCALDDKYEFVYTQAVTMHLKHDKAVEFIRNMANISSKYVFLMENWNNHNYPALLQESGVLNVFDFEFVQGEHQRYLILKK